MHEHDEIDEEERERVLAAVDEALDEGRHADALRAVAALGADDGERWLVEASVREELGDPFAAADAYARAEELLGAENPYYALQRGSWELSCWRLDRARELLGSIQSDDIDEPTWAATLDRRALLADVQGDHRRADELYARAHAASAEHPAPPPRLSEDAFRAVVEEAVQELPPEFQEAFELVPVVIDPMPTREILGAPESGFGPELLGLYSGLPLSEFQGVYGGGLPPRIHLFQRNLERAAADQDELREEIRVTLFHELGHALGFDEDEVDEMGLG